MTKLSQGPVGKDLLRYLVRKRGNHSLVCLALNFASDQCLQPLMTLKCSAGLLPSGTMVVDHLIPKQKYAILSSVGYQEILTGCVGIRERMHRRLNKITLRTG